MGSGESGCEKGEQSCRDEMEGGRDGGAGGPVFHCC